VTREARAGSGNRYRFSDRFIAIGTWVLIGILVVCLGAGLLLGFIGDGVGGDAGEILSGVAVCLIIGGFAVPLLAAAVLGGEAIKRGGGIIGFFLIVGLGCAVAGGAGGVAEELGPVWRPILLWGGIGLMVVACAGFWIIGYLAKVPMWIQAPVLGSPRLWVRRPGADEPEAPRARDERPGARGRPSGKRKRRR
jgi:hypothetical protein